MKEHRWCNLQLFAGEGAGEGGGDGAATGDNAVDAGQQRLLELGVPAAKLRKRAKRTAINQPGHAAAAARPARRRGAGGVEPDAPGRGAGDPPRIF